MALKNSFSFLGIRSISGEGFFLQTGEETVTTNQLYVKVDTISGNKNLITASVVLIDQESDKPVAYKQYQFALDLEGSNPIKQAYEYLKTLPEFTDATDC